MDIPRKRSWAGKDRQKFAKRLRAKFEASLAPQSTGNLVFAHGDLTMIQHDFPMIHI